MSQTFEFEIPTRGTIVINNPIVIDRCIENHNDGGQPVPYGVGQRGWRDMFYDLTTPADVIGMLALNCGFRDIKLSRLEGWADLPDDAITVITSSYVDSVRDESGDLL
jgi:hypothetical protein